ncbi:MAG: hypothetical protein CMO16_05835 [Thaumarchaeota archaeon]|nr:hypothetical protein [Nitrososphaerota archaeon]|tara:strand:+ start:397 stop:1194 length:798 start_codon:yes stop_codon:yes gene_type:complete
MSIPKFGMLTNPSLEILKEIETIYELDFDYVEIGIETPEGEPAILNKKKFKIMKLLKSFNTKPIGHTAPWIDLGSSYESVRRGWILESKKFIKVAKKLGLTLLNFHANTNGMFFGRNRKIILDNWVRSLREIVPYAKDMNVELMLENMPRGRAIHTLDEVEYITKYVPELQIHLDIPHAFSSGGIKSVQNYIRTFRERIAHIHWHDNHGVFDEHLPIGAGLIDHRRVVKALKEINYERTITLEIFTSKNDAKTSAEQLKDLWKTV